MESDERAIRAVHTRWIEAVNAGDLDCLLGLMADDLVLLGPGQAPFGQDRFPAAFKGGHDSGKLHCISELQEVVVVGDLAYTRCHDSLTLAPHTGGDTLTLVGDRLTIYRKQPDGRWLLARDAHTLTPVTG